MSCSRCGCQWDLNDFPNERSICLVCVGEDVIDYRGDVEFRQCSNNCHHMATRITRCQRHIPRRVCAYCLTGEHGGCRTCIRNMQRQRQLYYRRQYSPPSPQYSPPSPTGQDISRALNQEQQHEREEMLRRHAVYVEPEIPTTQVPTDSCVICMEDYVANDCIMKPQCGHWFHFHCLNNHLLSNFGQRRCKCPLCNLGIDKKLLRCEVFKSTPAPAPTVETASVECQCGDKRKDMGTQTEEDDVYKQNKRMRSTLGVMKAHYAMLMELDAEL